MNRALTLMLVPVLLLCFSTGVEAKKKNKNSSGLHGKIVSVSKSSITIQSHKSKDGTPGTQSTITIDANTTIEVDGNTGKTWHDLQAGQKVTIQGGTDGSAATDVQATSHHGKGKGKGKGKGRRGL